MATKLLDLARMTVASAPGLGPVALGVAVPSFLTLDQAGAIDGRTYRYGIRDGNAREVSQGVYTAATKTLARTVLKSTNSDSPINATAAAIVSGVVSAADIHGYTYSDTAPLSPVPGDLWYDSALGRLAIYTDDGTSQQWVGISPGSGGGSGAAAAAIGFKAHKNGVDQAVSGNVAQKVTATTEVYDVGGFYDAPNSRWTPPAGKVLITGAIQCVGMDTGAPLYANVLKNGSATDIYGSGGGWPGSNASFPIPVACPDIANGTDFYELSAYLFSGGSPKVVGTINRTFFAGNWLGP